MADPPRERNERTVTVYEATDPVRISLVQGALEDAGIPFVIANRVISSVYPVDGMAFQRFQVYVRDVERALEAIDAAGLGTPAAEED